MRNSDEIGLEINNNVDERFNLVLATKAAAQYLKQAKKEFGNWTLAAAACNAGRARLEVDDKQDVNGYYNLWLNEETSRYIFRILAVKDFRASARMDLSLFRSPLHIHSNAKIHS